MSKITNKKLKHVGGGRGRKSTTRTRKNVQRKTRKISIQRGGLGKSKVANISNVPKTPKTRKELLKYLTKKAKPSIIHKPASFFNNFKPHEISTGKKVDPKSLYAIVPPKNMRSQQNTENVTNRYNSLLNRSKRYNGSRKAKQKDIKAFLNSVKNGTFEVVKGADGKLKVYRKVYRKNTDWVPNPAYEPTIPSVLPVGMTVNPSYESAEQRGPTELLGAKPGVRGEQRAPQIIREKPLLSASPSPVSRVSSFNSRKQNLTREKLTELQKEINDQTQINFNETWGIRNP